MPLNPFAALRRPKQQFTRLEVTGPSATFSAFSADPYANDIFRAGVDAIARLAAKFVLQPRITFSDGTTADADDRLARLLQVEPNAFMSSFDMLYQIITLLYTNNNSYLYLHRADGQIVGLYPLHVTACEFTEATDGTVWCAMTFANGRTAILPYRDIVHLRRFFRAGDVAGDGNDAIAPAVELANAQNRAITDAIRQGGRVRGLVKFTGALGPSKLAAYQQAFNETQLTGNNSGVIVTDSALDFTPITDSAPTINAQDVAETKRKVFDYLGIPEAIVNSSFDDDGFGAFEESVLEALALQTSLEFTRKCYSPLQVARGRRIECSTARIRFIGMRNRVELLKHATPMGVLSVNETRDLLGLSPLAEDRVLQSLNYIDQDVAEDYQLNRALINARKDGLGTRSKENDD